MSEKPDGEEKLSKKQLNKLKKAEEKAQAKQEHKKVSSATCGVELLVAGERRCARGGSC
jgi:hypothetical protein